MTNKNQALLSDNQDSIIALCTPRGSGSIALLRLSGINAIEVADCFTRLSSGHTLKSLPTHTIHHGHVVAQATQQNSPPLENKKNEIIVDEVLFFLMRGPKTFTGQDTVEISCHNNPFIIEKIIECTLLHGARLAKAGEFTKRSFLNGKIDLLQAEAIQELISAQSELSLQKSLAQLQGSLSNHFSLLEAEIVALLGLVESSFEFLEEEQRDLHIHELITQRIVALQKNISELKIHFNQQQQIKQGVRVAIIGSTNAGKSTLFNALLKKERSIVTDVAGTTRDSIEASLYKQGNFWSVIDTAGLRSTEDFIEQQGIDRSLQEAGTADIILLVLDASKSLTDHEIDRYQSLYQLYKDKIIMILNKIDQQKTINSSALSFFSTHPCSEVSAKDKCGIEALEAAITEKIKVLFSELNSPFLLNQRQFNTIVEIETRLAFIANSYSIELQYELLAYQLKDMLEKISELTGRNISEGVLDKIFTTFCVGK